MDQSPIVLNDGFDQPKRISQGDLIFPAATVMERLLPPWEIIPEEYRRHSGGDESVRAWRVFFLWIMMNGLPPKAQMAPRDGIHPQLAFDNIIAITRSYAPKHEHKEAAVTWLLHRWFAGYSFEGFETDDDGTTDGEA